MCEQDPPNAIAEHQAVLAVIHGMYSNYLLGNRSEIDAIFEDSFTMFDSDHAVLLVGLDQLNAVRNSRPQGPGTPDEALSLSDERVRFAGAVAVVTYTLRVDFLGAPDTRREPEMVRNTAVLLHRGGEWKILHLHEDVHRQFPAGR